MAATLREQFQELKEDFNRLFQHRAEPAAGRMTHYERDYGQDGSFRYPEQRIDESAGSECLDD